MCHKKRQPAYMRCGRLIDIATRCRMRSEGDRSVTNDLCLARSHRPATERLRHRRRAIGRESRSHKPTRTRISPHEITSTSAGERRRRAPVGAGRRRPDMIASKVVLIMLARRLSAFFRGHCSACRLRLVVACLVLPAAVVPHLALLLRMPQQIAVAASDTTARQHGAPHHGQPCAETGTTSAISCCNWVCGFATTVAPPADTLPGPVGVRLTADVEPPRVGIVVEPRERPPRISVFRIR